MPFRKFSNSASRTDLLINVVQKLSMSRDLNEIMGIVKLVSRQLIGSDGATFVLRENGYCYYADEDAIGPLWKGNRFPMEKCISGWVMKNCKSVIIQDIYKDERIPLDAYRPTFVKSLVMVPIRTINPIGAIGNYWAKKPTLTSEDIQLLEALADITAVSIENIEVRNRLQSQLKERTQMFNHIKKQKQQLEDFTHIIAHNMRAPLANLIILNNLINSSHSLDEKLDFLEKQKSVVDLLQETFDELVNITQVKMDFSIQNDYLELEELFPKILDLLQGEIISNKVEITYDFSKNKSLNYPKSYMESILLNLLSNSIKYRSKIRNPKVHIKSYRFKGWNYLKIEDNGLGLDLKKHKKNLFKLRKTFHDHPNAKGFGLFMTKTQVESMGGDIGVKSAPDKGAVFIVKLNKIHPNEKS